MTEQQQQVNYDLAKKRVKKIKGFYIHLLVYIIVNVFLIINKNNHQGWDNFFTFNTFSTAFYWGFGLIFHAFNVFVRDNLLGKNWEEKKIKEFIAEEKKKGWE